MKNYVLVLIGLSILCGMMELLVPKSSGGSLKKHVRLTASLCVLCAIAAPLGNLISYLKDESTDIGNGCFEKEALKSEYEEIYNKNISSITAESIEQGCERMINERFGVSIDAIDVVVSVSASEELKVERVLLIIYSGAVAYDPHSMSDFLKELLDCDCEIIYK